MFYYGGNPEKIWNIDAYEWKYATTYFLITFFDLPSGCTMITMPL